MTLDELNALEDQAAIESFHGCCHCWRWARQMVLSRPFESVGALLERADELWARATHDEILEAFRGHARIGDMEALKSRYSSTTSDEQGQVLQTSEEVIRELYELNLEYERRHGFIFIVCATGKSAEEMLELLRGRVHNSTPQEMINGAREQRAIIQLRLQKMVSKKGNSDE